VRRDETKDGIYSWFLLPIPKLSLDMRQKCERLSTMNAYRFTRHQLSIVLRQSGVRHRDSKLRWSTKAGEGGWQSMAPDRGRVWAGDVGAFTDIDEHGGVVCEPVLGYSGTGTRLT